ncbi:MAG: hypothetical protein WC444_07040 [Candidatus Paceibacterota bacterium]
MKKQRKDRKAMLRRKIYTIIRNTAVIDSIPEPTGGQTYYAVLNNRSILNMTKEIIRLVEE